MGSEADAVKYDIAIDDIKFDRCYINEPATNVSNSYSTFDLRNFDFRVEFT